MIPVKNVICKKCGKEYDSNYKSCPHCGFNPLKNTIKIISLILCALLFLSTTVSTIFLLIKVNNLEKEIATIKSSILSESTGTEDLMSQSYYSTYEITDENSDDITSRIDTYIIYFHQENCTYCKEANQFIDQYVTLGYSGYLPVLFATPDNAEKLFKDYNIESTPSAIYIKNGSVVKLFEGVDDVFDLFNTIVEEAQGE